jgi:hypothetical protein
LPDTHTRTYHNRQAEAKTQLDAVFKAADKDKSGTIDASEFFACFHALDKKLKQEQEAIAATKLQDVATAYAEQLPDMDAASISSSSSSSKPTATTSDAKSSSSSASSAEAKQ